MSVEGVELPSQPIVIPPQETILELVGDLRENALMFGKTAARVAGCLACASIVSFPLASSLALDSASINTNIAQSPATIEYTGNGESSLLLGWPGGLFLPKSFHGVGVTAQVHGPGDLQSYFTGDAIKVYTGLFKNPGEAVDGYKKLLFEDAIDHYKDYQLFGTIGFGAVALLGVELIRERRKRREKGPVPLKWALGLSLATTAVATMATTGIAKHYIFDDFVENSPQPQLGEKYPLNKTKDTAFDGAYSDVSELRSLADNGISTAQRYIERGESRGQTYTKNAIAQLEAQKSLIAAPREDEVAILGSSDWHDNEPAAKIATATVEMINTLYGDGTVNAVFSAGDNGYGTAAEARYYYTIAGISGDAPFFSVEGNHDLPPAVTLLQSYGVEFGDREVLSVGDNTMLGMADPRKTEFMGPTTPKDGIELEYELGKEARAIAEKEHPQFTILHECYAAMGFINRTNAPDFFAAGANQNYQIPSNDIYPDVPTSLVACGHWHEPDVPFRVLGNSDGSWTVLIEFNTAGGAIGDPTLGNFSIPYEPPKQMGSFMILYKNKTSGLITGAQIYKMYPDGKFTIEPRIDIGSSDGQPFTIQNFVNPQKSAGNNSQNPLAEKAG